MSYSRSIQNSAKIVATHGATRRAGIVTPPPVAGGGGAAPVGVPAPVIAGGGRGKKKAAAPAAVPPPPPSYATATASGCAGGQKTIRMGKELPPKPFPRFLALFRPVEDTLTMTPKEVVQSCKTMNVPPVWEHKMLGLDGLLLSLLAAAGLELDVALMVYMGRQLSLCAHEEKKEYKFSTTQHTSLKLGSHFCYPGWCPDYTHEASVEKAVSTCNIPMLQFLHAGSPSGTSVFTNWTCVKEALVVATRYRHAPVLRYLFAKVLCQANEEEQQAARRAGRAIAGRTFPGARAVAGAVSFVPHGEEQAAPLVEAILQDWHFAALFFLKECKISPLFPVVLRALMQHGSPAMLRLVMSFGLDSTFVSAALTDAAQPLDALHDTMVHFSHHRNESTFLEFLSLVLTHLKCKPQVHVGNQASAYKLAFNFRFAVRGMKPETLEKVRWLLYLEGGATRERKGWGDGESFWREVDALERKKLGQAVTATPGLGAIGSAYKSKVPPPAPASATNNKQKRRPPNRK